MNVEFKTIAGQVVAAFKYSRDTITIAAMNTIKESAAFTKKAGRAAISAGGMSRKWENAFRVNVYPEKGNSINAAYLAHHNISYARVFEDGATIQGSPLLWVPLPAAPGKVGGRRVTAGNYRELIGSPLHTINRPGKRPLLAAYVVGDRPARGKRLTAAKLKSGARAAGKAKFNPATGRRSKKVQLVSVPLFVGIPVAHLRKRFNLTAVFRQAVAALPETYAKNLQAVKLKQ